MIWVRVSKIAMAIGIAVFAFLTAYGNTFDYDSNWTFVQHVLSMDTVFPGSQLKSRAITSTTLQQIAYLSITITEALTALAFLVAAVQMSRKLTAPRGEFVQAKAMAAVGVMLGFGLWFGGFMAIGGEWFAMWQSSVWNGQEAAFRFYMPIMAAGIYIFQDSDGEVDRIRPMRFAGWRR